MTLTLASKYDVAWTHAFLCVWAVRPLRHKLLVEHVGPLPHFFHDFLEFVFVCDGDGQRERCEAPLLSGETSCEGRDTFVFLSIPQRLHLESIDHEGIHDDMPRFEMGNIRDGEHTFILERFLP